MLELKDKRCIFLDFDGVINNIGYKETDELDKIFELRSENMPHATLDNIAPLNSLFMWCYMNNVKIVISSSWMIGGLEKCKRALKEIVGNILVDRLVIGGTKYTRRLSHPVRSKEIQMWLDRNPEYKYYLLVDDCDSFTDDHKKLWVKTVWHDGLTDEKVNEIISRFKNLDTEQKWIDYEYYKEPVKKITENDI